MIVELSKKELECFLNDREALNSYRQMLFSGTILRKDNAKKDWLEGSSQSFKCLLFIYLRMHLASTRVVR